MPSRTEAHYLRLHRKRSGLTQKEVASVLGCSDTNIGRYENFHRLPDLQTSLALGVLFDVPVDELFAGVHEAVSFVLRRRAKRLAQRLGRKKSSPARSAKLAALRLVPERPSRRRTGGDA